MQLRILTALVLALFMASCSTDSDEPFNPINDTKDTTNNGGGIITPITGLNINPDFSFMFKEQKIQFSKIQADYGGKTYFFGHDKAGRFALDMAIPMPKGVVASGKTFTIEDDQYTAMGLFIDGMDNKWYFEGGTLNVTKNSANTMSGTFTAKCIILDYTNPEVPKRTDSTMITNGVFNNLKVKG